MSSKAAITNWGLDPADVEQKVFRQMLQKLSYDGKGKMINFTYNPSTLVISIEFVCNEKSLKLICSALRRVCKTLPEDFPKRQEFINTVNSELMMYKRSLNMIRLARRKKEGGSR